MNPMISKLVFAVTVLAILVSPGLAQNATFNTGRPAAENGESASGNDLAMAWGSFEMVFTGEIESVQRGPMAMSQPPIYSSRLTFKVKKSIRGSLRPGRSVVLAHSIQQEHPPVFDEGRMCIVGAQTGDHGVLTLIRVEEATRSMLAAVLRDCELPVGWVRVEGKPISPWAPLGDAAWPKNIKVSARIVCASSGRPALLCGDAVEFRVSPLPPKKSIQWTNPDGDGDYQLSVSNRTSRAIEVPALLTDGQEVYWANSVVILCQGRVYPLPNYRNDQERLIPVKLPPHGTVSGTVNPLALTGPDWPRGGYRIRFQFGLGEKSASHSFYYVSRHHDAIREALPNAK